MVRPMPVMSHSSRRDTRHVTARWDSEARVWWAESDDIPGLVTEAATLDELLERCGAVTGELLAANGEAQGSVASLIYAKASIPRCMPSFSARRRT